MRWTFLVLPIIILGGIAVAGAVALSGGFSGLGSALDRFTKSDERKNFELQKEMNEYHKSKRGFFENAYAFLFGETELRKVGHPNQASPQAPLTGQQNQTKQQYEQTQNFPDAKKRVLRNG